MARAKRHCLAGHTWHITHRCRKREFLLKFAKDRRRYLQWLWEDRYHATAVETDRHLLQGFVEKTRQELGIRAKGRKVVEAGASYQLREPQLSYSANFGLENDDIGAENTYFWDVY